MSRPQKESQSAALPGFDEADLDAVAAVWTSSASSLAGLVRAGGLDPKKDLQRKDLRGWPLSGQDVRGIDFTESDLRGTGIEGSIYDSSTVLTGAILDRQHERDQ